MNKIITKSRLSELQYVVTGAAIEVHRALGPNLLESIYKSAMLHELKLRKIDFLAEAPVPVVYKGTTIKSNLRCDLLINDLLPVELKAVSEVQNVHVSQILTYMKLLNAPQGLLYNFNVPNMFKFGQTSFVYNLYRSIPD